LPKSVGLVHNGQRWAERLTSLSFKRPVAPFEGLADEFEERFIVARFAFDDSVPLVFRWCNVSALGLPFLLVLAGTVFQHGFDAPLSPSEGRIGAIVCTVIIFAVFLAILLEVLFTLGDSFEGSFKLGFRKPVVVRVALGAEFLCESAQSLTIPHSQGDSPTPQFDKAEDI
jgi:hypothetical protein